MLEREGVRPWKLAFADADSHSQRSFSAPSRRFQLENELFPAQTDSHRVNGSGSFKFVSSQQARGDSALPKKQLLLKVRPAESDDAPLLAEAFPAEFVRIVVHLTKRR